LLGWFENIAKHPRIHTLRVDEIGRPEIDHCSNLVPLASQIRNLDITMPEFGEANGLGTFLSRTTLLEKEEEGSGSEGDDKSEGIGTRKEVYSVLGRVPSSQIWRRRIDDCCFLLFLAAFWVEPPLF
jgi:hypothetical protein